jgi:peptidoglycan/xylan/chitin deacetylase (PgdA/CDA1 family)
VRASLGRPLLLSAMLLALAVAGCAPQPMGASAPHAAPAASAKPVEAPVTVLVPVLCYHHVLPKAPNSIAVTPAVFETQLRTLKDEGFSTISPEQLEAAFSREGTLPPKPVMITFDDGWRNQSLFAAPLLRKYGFTATFFVYPQLIHDKPSVFMSKSEVKALADAGFSIGSHTWSHGDVRRKRGEQDGAYTTRMRGELTRSKEWIESVTGTSTISIAYPYGYWDGPAASAVASAGYELAFTTDDQVVSVPGADRYALGRFPVTRASSLASFRAKVVSGLLPISALTPIPGEHVAVATSTVSAVLATVPPGPIVAKIDFVTAPSRIDTSGPLPRLVFTAKKPLGRGFHWVTVLGADADGRRLYAAWGFTSP